MNFEQSNSFMEEELKKSRKKKVVMVSMGICVVLILLMLILIWLIQFQDAQALKMFVNGTEVAIPSTLYKQEEDTIYVNVRQIGEMLGYHYTQGEYNKYNEDETSCYLTNDYEIVTFTVEEDSFTKYAEFSGEKATIAQIPVVVKSENGQAQKYSLNTKIKLIDGIIYAPLESLPDMFNAQVNLAEKNRIKIYSIDQVVASAQNSIKRFKYSSMSGDYENLKAMLYGLAVVGDGTNFGVISLTDGKIIVGIKYDDITFLPNLRDFLIKADNTVGIISEEGNTVIKPTEYDEISVYDEENLLYLVKKDNKYGVLNRLGEVIVYPDYDEIGYTFSKSKNELEEYKVIYDKCIPVKESGKYGLYSINGDELLPCAYDEFGSMLSAETNSANEKPILLIPPEIGVKGIIINQNGLYGLYDVTSEEIIIPIACTRAYSITKTAITTYYVEHAGVQYNLDEYLEVNNLKNINTENDSTTKNNTTIENTVVEDNTTEEGNTVENPEEDNPIDIETTNTVETSSGDVTTP